MRGRRVNRMQLSSHGLGAGAALALSGVDMALWDARGKALGLPVYRLLGGGSKRIPAYAGGISMGFQAPASLADEAASYVKAGYRAVKLRLGDNPIDDVARVRAVREHVGDAIGILTDANTAYTLADARRVIPALAEARVGWLEEPFGCNDFGAYRAGAQLSNTVPIAAGENHYTRFDFARLIEDRSVQIFQPDLSKTGGISEGMKIAAIASAWGIPVHPHSSKKNPGAINFASTGSGSSNHLSMELFMAMTGTKMVHIPYKGSAPARTALAAGEVDVLFDNTPNLLALVQAGRVDAIAVTSLKRSALLPEVPTIDEAGVKGYEVDVWFGIQAPAGTPQPIVEKLNAKMVEILKEPKVIESFAQKGVSIAASTPQRFEALVASEIAKWGKLVKDAGIRIE